MVKYSNRTVAYTARIIEGSDNQGPTVSWDLHHDNYNNYILNELNL